MLNYSVKKRRTIHKSSVFAGNAVPCSAISFFRGRDVGIPPYCTLHGNGTALKAVPYGLCGYGRNSPSGEYHFCHRQKYHIASAIYHTHLRISLVWVGADIIRPNESGKTVGAIHESPECNPPSFCFAKIHLL